MRLQIRISNSDSRQAQVFLSGEVDLETVAELSAMLEGIAQTKAKQILLDLSKLSYLGSVGVSVIIRTLDELNACGKQLIITGAHGPVKVVLEMLGLSHLVRRTASPHAHRMSVTRDVDRTQS